MGLRTSYNKTYQQQANKLLPATFKKAFVSAIYPNLHAVDIYFVGNQQTIIQKVALASHIDITSIKVGDRCRVDIFDETNPNDMVVAYAY